MYGDFATAMVNQMTARMDPMNQIIGTMMSGQVESQQDTLRRQKTDTVGYITAALNKAREDDNPNVSVIEAYERLLAQATAAAR